MFSGALRKLPSCRIFQFFCLDGWDRWEVLHFSGWSDRRYGLCRFEARIPFRVDG